MDLATLKFVDERHKMLRESYEKYKQEYPAAQHKDNRASSRDRNSDNSHNGRVNSQKHWAWNNWSDEDLSQIVDEVLSAGHNTLQQLPSYSSERWFKEQLIQWVEDYMDDTGTMFRLYRKGGYKREESIRVLMKALSFRIRHLQDLTWSPVATDTHPSNRSSSFEHDNDQYSGLRSRNRSDSRTSAQSPRASPDHAVPSQEESHIKWENFDSRLEDPDFGESLVQVYPPSPMDPENRPLAIVTLRYLHEAGNDEQSMSPKAQVLAAFERVRRYLAKWGTEGAGVRSTGKSASGLQPLQFILVINLENGRVTSTAWDIVRWLARDASDQFYGMCSAVFVVNYSWEFGAIWSFIKHALPASAKAKVMFPTLDDLKEYLGETVLPPSLGGSCTTPLPHDPPIFEPTPRQDKSLVKQEIDQSPFQEENTSSLSKGRPAPIHSTSSENPFFGYPVIQDPRAVVNSGTRSVRLQHSRKRKRDLIRTLFWLLLMKWQGRFTRLIEGLRQLRPLRAFRSNWVLLFVAIVYQPITALPSECVIQNPGCSPSPFTIVLNGNYFSFDSDWGHLQRYRRPCSTRLRGWLVLAVYKRTSGQWERNALSLFFFTPTVPQVVIQPAATSSQATLQFSTK